MKKTLLGATLMLGAALSAQADESRPFKFLLGAGLTFGGDTLVTVQFDDGHSEDVDGGGLVHLYAGAEYRLGTAVSLQATLGYHVDNSTGSNGSVRFSRMPVDLLAHYHVNDQVRLGAGVQFVNNPELKGSGDASDVNVKFDSATGTILEGEYLFSPSAGVKLRYVAEKFKLSGGGGAEADGNHFGIMLNYYF
ncbi:outer membrane beta-barrel protein [Piscinibacter sp.]|uniref:outer membrane beta-barrel protein n=1 Tax=Piscinibacter sp. TaxID=1903157 RepID=UPI002CA46E4C|nr:outer membrane beta-barrel protein [Albitalea sp.]HUG22880.1 outer membrane beta-barrel protein [Albitalea sp.]